MTHTPGPWHLTATQIVVDANGDEVATPGLAAQLLNAGENARLIAAAPDLFAALKALINWLDCGDPLIDKARAAIARVEDK